jgi:hypothetical protein
MAGFPRFLFENIALMMDGRIRCSYRRRKGQSDAVKAKRPTSISLAERAEKQPNSKGYCLGIFAFPPRSPRDAGLFHGSSKEMNN